ncbi:glycosyltransferase family 1 protein [Pacificibacter sp. AS14]|uniref:glycosyltransferase family 4 protein n=1 Tax=Pacificibacter sp. AS14 TaxID=3135785 RepID=UPI003173ACE5
MPKQMPSEIVLNGRFLLQDVTGVQRVQREVLAALDEMAAAGDIPTPIVLLPAQGNIVAEPVLKSIKFTRTGRFSGHLWEQLELPKLCKGKTLLCLGNTAPVVSLLSKTTRVVTMVHDLSYKYFPTAYSWKFKAFYSTLIPLVLRKSDAVVTVSLAEKKAMSRHYPFLAGLSGFHGLQNGGLPDAVATAFLSDGVPDKEQRGHGIYVGSLSKRKNADSVLRAAVTFLQTYPDMKFVVIGAGSSVFESLSVDVPEDIKDRLEMWGQINDPLKIYDAFKHARFLVFPSFYEASPLPPIEAMTLGCAVVSSSIPSLQERCGDAAVYCDPDDLSSITAAVDRLMTEPDLWENLSQAGRVQAAKYSWKSQTEALLNICEDVA